MLLAILDGILWITALFRRYFIFMALLGAKMPHRLSFRLRRVITAALGSGTARMITVATIGATKAAGSCFFTAVPGATRPNVDDIWCSRANEN
jgi:hypothetical protein